MVAQSEWRATLGIVMRRRIVRLAVGLMSILGMVGCLEVEQVITLKQDGSGTITEEMVLGAGIVNMLKDVPIGAGGAFPDLYKEEKYRELAASYGEGVTFFRMEKVARDGGEGVRVTYRFADINKVVFAPGSTLDNVKKEAEGEAENEDEAVNDEPLRFAFAEGVLTVRVPDVSRERKEGRKPAPLGNDPLEAVMMQMFKGMKVGSRMVVVPGIEESDASYQEGNTITFLKFDFDKILENPNGIKALGKLDGATRVELKASLEGVKGAQVETKPVIRIKVKETILLPAD